MSTDLPGRTHPWPRRCERTDGLTLLEVMIAMTVLTLGAVTIGLGLQVGSLSAREVRDRTVVATYAHNLITLLHTVPFGSSDDPLALPGELDEIFDGDADAGTIHLRQLTGWPEADLGWRFRLSSIPVPGEWRVVVSHDLNGDGLLGDTAGVVGLLAHDFAGHRHTTEMATIASGSTGTTISGLPADIASRDVLPWSSFGEQHHASALTRLEDLQEAVIVLVYFDEELILHTFIVQEASS